MNECGQEGSIWHIQYGATVIRLACLGVERKKKMHHGDTANWFWQDQSVKHKQLWRQKKVEEEEEEEERGGGEKQGDKIQLLWHDSLAWTRKKGV